jgi:hypothetical protein
MVLTEIPMDKDCPMVCCGCGALGPIENNKGEWTRDYPRWYHTKVIYIGYYKYQRAVHCGDCNTSEGASWPISALEDYLNRNAEGAVTVMPSQQKSLERIGWKPEVLYVVTPEMLAKTIMAPRTKVTWGKS